MKRLSILLIAPLCGCMTLPVHGKVVDGTTEFVGEATGYLTMSGDLEMTASDGRECKGSFAYSGMRMGHGKFTCADGTVGTFSFNSTGRSGVGFGTTNKGERIKFTFGNQAASD